MAGTASTTRPVLRRAFAASTALAVGAVGTTGVFIARIANSAAQTHSGSSRSANPPDNDVQPPRSDDGAGVLQPPGEDDGGGGGGTGATAGQPPSAAQQQQSSVGGSNGS